MMERKTGIGALAATYDGFILDAWGTLHEGGPALPAALEAVAALRAAGRRIAVVSNTPQIGTVLAHRLTAQGLPEDLYDFAYTAGDLTVEALQRRDAAFLAGIGTCAYHLAPERFPDLLTGTAFRLVDRIEDADLLVNGGPDQDDATLADFTELFRAAVARRVPMVCANPDRAIVDRGVRKMCAGELAATYEDLGGQVHYFGKPHPTIFERALDRLGTRRDRTLVVGDGLFTDIAGAAAANIDSLLIAGGLHGATLLTGHGTTLVDGIEAAVAALLPAHRVRYVTPRLAW